MILSRKPVFPQNFSLFRGISTLAQASSFCRHPYDKFVFLIMRETVVVKQRQLTNYGVVIGPCKMFY